MTMSEQPMRSIPMPESPNDVVQVVITVRQLALLKFVAKQVNHCVVGPFQINDEDVPTMFLHPVLKEES
jgi:hypothetical protein